MKRTANGRRVAVTAGEGGRAVVGRSVRQGIARQSTRAKVQPPLSDRHRAVMALLDPDSPRQAKEIGDRLGLRPHQVQSALYVLQSRGLALHLTNLRGWVLVLAPEAGDAAPVLVQPEVHPATTR